MEADEKKFTQADLDRHIADRLQREREKIGDIEALRAENTSLKTTLEQEKATRQKLEGDLSALNLNDLKARIAKEFNLPEKLIPLVPGKTEDELRAGMKALAESIGPGPAMGAGTNPATPTPQRFSKQQVERMSPEEITRNWATIEAQLKDGSLNKAG